MSGPVNALVILAVIGVVLARQLRPRAVAGGRWWPMPAVLLVPAIRDQGGLVDGQREHAPVTLLAVAATPLIRSGVLFRRARSLGPSYRTVS